jgi:zinc and cadmium transporter
MNKATLIEVILFSLGGGILSLLGSVLLISGNTLFLKKFSRLAVPFAAGALLAAVFLDLLKEGLDHSTADTVLVSTLIGILGFFTLERATQWFHHHHDEDKHHHENVSLFILANTLHNALDGIAIGSAFLISVPAGVITTIAVAAHEIPHEIGDIGVLLERGLSRSRVILVNFVGALSAVILAVLAFSVGGDSKLPVGVLLGVSAGFLIYVAASDLIPTIHRKKLPKGSIDTDLIILLFGVVAVAVAVQLAHRYIK